MKSLNPFNKKENRKIKTKGDISISMLIWVALGLVVLIIFISVLTGKIKFMNNNTPDTSCPNLATNCLSPDTPCPHVTDIRIKTNDCSGTADKPMSCCKPLG